MNQIVLRSRISGLYDDEVNVAIKFAANQKVIRREIKVLNALNAMDRNIETCDIPRVYYHGMVLDQYLAIAMSLFDGTLDDLYKRYKGNISELQILEIFKQAVSEILNLIKYYQTFLNISIVYLGPWIEISWK